MKIALCCCPCYLVNICQLVSHLWSPPVCVFLSLFSNLPSLISLLRLQYESDELEKSVYQDYDSDSDVPEELKQDYVDEQTGDAPLKRSVPSSVSPRDLFKCSEKYGEHSGIFSDSLTTCKSYFFKNAFSIDNFRSPEQYEAEE